MRADAALVAVTGAGGFVGRAIVRRLLADGFRVRALSRGASSAPEGAERVVLPAPEDGDDAFALVLEGAAHLVHGGALTNTDRRLADSAYQAPNVELTGRLARGAARVVPGRMVFLSSIRAAAGPLFAGRITDAMTPAPADAYGRSKLAGEAAAVEAFAARAGDLAMLRLAPVYGPGMKGMLAGLLRLADTPLPLPLAGLTGRRSLLGLDAAAGAAAHLLTVPVLPPSPMVVSDAEALSVAEMIAAMREGLGRPRRMMRVPAWMLGGPAHLLGKKALWRGLAASQVCVPERLSASGWEPVGDTRRGLAQAGRDARSQS